MEQQVDRTETLCRSLGYVGSSTFFDRSTDLTLAGHDVREALTALGMHGVFCLGDGFPGGRLKPMVYIAYAADDGAFLRLRRDAWTQGIVPFVLIVKGDEVFVCNAFSSPEVKVEAVALPEPDESLPVGLESFRAGSIGSSLAWAKFSLDRSDSVHGRLIRGIEQLNSISLKKHPVLALHPGLVNALIGKLVFLYVLVDRGIITKDWLNGQLAEKASTEHFLASIFDGIRGNDDWGTSEAFEVFEVLDREINGSVFRIEAELKDFIPDEIVRLVHEVLRLGSVLQSGDGAQLSFLGLSYRVLRTETISAMYESFVTIQDSTSKTKDGIFYTPPHLADHVLDRVEAVVPLDAKARVIDAAAGSGIFLVGAYRRVMEREMPQGGWSLSHFQFARHLLETCIHGFEKHPEAASVARFSLQLTLLDYVGTGDIEQLVAENGRRFLPTLDANIRVADAFDPAVAPIVGYPDDDGRYTHVVGNPPWSSTSGQRDRLNRSAKPVVEDGHASRFVAELKEKGVEVKHARLADLFMWLAVSRLTRPDGVIALVLPTKSLIGRHANAFTAQLSRTVSLYWVANLSHLRRKLFVGVEAPASVVVVRNRKSKATDMVGIYRPFFPSLPGGQSNEIWRLLAAPAEIRYRRSDRMSDGPNGWMTTTMLSELDARMREALSIYAQTEQRTIGDFLARSGLIISKGGSAEESGIDRSDGTRVHSLLPLGGDRFDKVKPDYRGFFAGNVVLMPRSMGQAKYHVGPIAYSSSFNGIVPAEQHERGLRTTGPLETMPLSQASVTALVAFLNSGMLRYFAALFGATYLIDGMRVEKNDLLEMPCPFEDLSDASFLRLADAEQVDAVILDALEAGAEFRAAYAEHKGLRQGFGNSRVPAKSMLPPSNSERESYVRRLVPELQAALDLPVSVDVATVEGTSLDAVSISFGDVDEANGIPHMMGEYLGASTIVVNRNIGSVRIVKGRMLYAWTIDQAVSDAIAVLRALRN